MRPIEEIRACKKLKIRHEGPAYMDGTVYLKGVACSIVLTWDNEVEHVSVAPYDLKLTPTWDMMAQLKEIIYKDDEAAVQIHPRKDEYVNIKKNCLHIWRPTSGTIKL